MPEVLRAFREVTDSAPDKLTLWYHTYQFPPMPELPEEIRGKSFTSVAVHTWARPRRPRRCWHHYVPWTVW